MNKYEKMTILRLKMPKVSALGRHDKSVYEIKVRNLNFMKTVILHTSIMCKEL